MKQGWEIKKLGEVATFCSGYTPKETELMECGDVPYFKVSDMNHTLNTKYLQHTSLFLDNGCKTISKNTIVFPKNGAAIATNKKRILQQDSVVDLNTGGVSANNDLLFYEYLYLYFLNIDFRLHTRRGAVPTLDIAELKKLPIPIPPLPEQEKIVAELDCLSGIIEKKREQLKELDAFAQSIFYTMFGDPITNEKGWEVDRLGNLCDISSSKRIYAHEYCDNGIPFYRGKEISEKSKGNDISVELYISEERYNELKNKFGVPQIGDILLTAVGTIGNIWVVDSCTPFYFKDGNVLWLQAKENINPIYFKTLLYNLIDKYKESMANGCAYSALTIVNLKEMKTNKVPYTLQQEFADKIALIEKQKQLIKESIAQTEELFNSRMAYYFN